MLSQNLTFALQQQKKEKHKTDNLYNKFSVTFDKNTRVTFSLCFMLLCIDAIISSITKNSLIQRIYFKSISVMFNVDVVVVVAS